MKNSKEKLMIGWHHILGMTFTDFYFYSSFRVDLERELKYPQYIDILILEGSEGDKIENPPDGLENLRKYNLITYKSIRQPLDSWALDELICYYVLFRKILSLPLKYPIPISEFNLIGIATRFPQKLNKEETLEYSKKGVYKLKRGEHTIKIIVTSQTPKKPENAIWQMFSGNPEKIIEGLSNYNWNRDDYKHLVLQQLIHKYKSEGVKMPYTEKDFFRDTLGYYIRSASIEDILKYKKTEDILKGIKPEDVFKNYKPEDVFKNYKPEDILKGLKAINLKID